MTPGKAVPGAYSFNAISEGSPFGRNSNEAAG
jgi:hypothetical protein